MNWWMISDELYEEDHILIIKQVRPNVFSRNSTKSVESSLIWVVTTTICLSRVAAVYLSNKEKQSAHFLSDWIRLQKPASQPAIAVSVSLLRQFHGIGESHNIILDFFLTS